MPLSFYTTYNDVATQVICQSDYLTIVASNNRLSGGGIKPTDSTIYDYIISTRRHLAQRCLRVARYVYTTTKSNK